MTSPEKREVVEWEDTLTQKEIEYTERVKAQQQTVNAFKSAKEENTFGSYLGALTLHDVPDEFREVKREFKRTVIDLVSDIASLNLLSVKTYDDMNRLHVVIKDSEMSRELVDIDLAKKIMLLDERNWLESFRRYPDPFISERFDWYDKHLTALLNDRDFNGALNDKDIARVRMKWEHVIEKNGLLKEYGKEPKIENLLTELSKIITLFQEEGFQMVQKGMKPTTHYVLRTPFRWEEDHRESLTKRQQKYARPVNHPTRDQCHTSYSTLVEIQISSLLSLSTHDNEFTRDWYERRLTVNELKELERYFTDEAFKVVRMSNQVQIKHIKSGNILVVYLNGNIWAYTPDEAPENSLYASIGLMPFVLHPGFSEWGHLISANTFKEND